MEVNIVCNVIGPLTDIINRHILNKHYHIILCQYFTGRTLVFTHHSMTTSTLRYTSGIVPRIAEGHRLDTRFAPVQERATLLKALLWKENTSPRLASLSPNAVQIPCLPILGRGHE